MAEYSLISPETPIQEVMSHPVFQGRGYLLFPWEDKGRYPKGMRMADVSALMPWHTFVNIPEVVAGVNRLIQDAVAGKQVIYDIYDDKERAKDSSKSQVVLFFLRGKPDAPWVLIAPGGGFVYVATLHEGLPVGMELNRRGYNAFILRYRVGRGEETASGDLVAAIRYILAKAQTLGVSSENYALWGFSAGARMVLRAAYDERFQSRLPRSPSMTVIAYTAGSLPSFSPGASPAFLLVGTRDGIAPWERMTLLAERMKAAGIKVHLHVVEGAPHGFGKGTGSPAEGWIDEALAFWG